MGTTIGIGIGVVFLNGTSAAQLAFTGSLTVEKGSAGPHFTLVVLNNPATNPYDGFAEVTDADNVSTLANGDEVTISGAVGAHAVSYKATSSGGRPDLTIALTITIQDTVAPVLTLPTDTKTGSTTATLTVTTDTGEGTLYAVSVLAGTQPTSAQVIAGQDSTGSAAGYAHNQAVSASGLQTVSATGLVAATHYLASYFAQKDASNNVSLVSAADGFTTDSAGSGNDANTVLLLHLNGTNGSTTFTDSSTGGAGSPHTFTATGDTQITTSQAKFGTGSLSINTGGLAGDGSADFAFGTGDFTIEAFVYVTSNGSFAIYGFEGYAQQFGFYTGNAGAAYYYDGNFQINGSTIPTTNAWHHFAYVRSAGTGTIYLDGVSQGSWADNHSYSNAAGQPQFGNGQAGLMDELRISNIARWTSNFTPPVAAYS